MDIAHCDACRTEEHKQWTDCCRTLRCECQIGAVAPDYETYRCTGPKLYLRIGNDGPAEMSACLDGTPLRLGDVMLWVQPGPAFPEFNPYGSVLAARAYGQAGQPMVGGPVFLSGIGPRDTATPLPAQTADQYRIECAQYLRQLQETKWT